MATSTRRSGRRIALDRFFTESNLTALRELALRFVAGRVDAQLEGIGARPRDPERQRAGPRPRRRRRRPPRGRSAAPRRPPRSSAPRCWPSWSMTPADASGVVRARPPRPRASRRRHRPRGRDPRGRGRRSGRGCRPRSRQARRVTRLVIAAPPVAARSSVARKSPLAERILERLPSSRSRSSRTRARTRRTPSRSVVATDPVGGAAGPESGTRRVYQSTAWRAPSTPLIRSASQRAGPYP